MISICRFLQRYLDQKMSWLHWFLVQIFTPRAQQWYQNQASHVQLLYYFSARSIHKGLKQRKRLIQQFQSPLLKLPVYLVRNLLRNLLLLPKRQSPLLKRLPLLRLKILPLQPPPNPKLGVLPWNLLLNRLPLPKLKNLPQQPPPNPIPDPEVGDSTLEPAPEVEAQVTSTPTPEPEAETGGVGEVETSIPPVIEPVEEVVTSTPPVPEPVSEEEGVVAPVPEPVSEVVVEVTTPVTEPVSEGSAPSSEEAAQEEEGPADEGPAPEQEDGSIKLGNKFIFTTYILAVFSFVFFMF
eukprot:TRINITY_DN4435_c0_g1_i11.p1 TRINITY_DN4435_c0_g1~~TRINITY_DN4435_c0_g1_i11.p1  ORF type:complete len:295 (-),score=43.70 TRINITY_DN4435_c0_g1_i11:804-1688(-)